METCLEIITPMSNLDMIYHDISVIYPLLVGGLEHFYFFIDWEFYHPN